jgi:hypothetical protein
LTVSLGKSIKRHGGLTSNSLIDREARYAIDSLLEEFFSSPVV